MTSSEVNNDNVVELNACTQDDISAWQDCIKSAIFSDLITLREMNAGAFNELYYGRENEILEFCNALEIIKNTGRNFLIIGEAGVGKSTYLYKIFLGEDGELKNFIFPVFIDFRKGAISIDAALINFIDKLDSYFQEVDYPINTLEKPKEVVTIPYNLIKISEHLSSFMPRDNSKALLVLVDDLDYADEFWLDFLVQIHNLVLSPKMSFVLSVRPLLEFKIRSSNDVLYRDLVRASRRIELGCLSVSDLLHKRLAPLIRENQENPFHHFIKRLFRRDSAICRILREQYGIRNIEQLARFEFPFTGKLMDFMAQITNGNIREIFDIAETVLRYIFLNSRDLETREEAGEIKYVIEREVIIRLFKTERKKYDSNYELFNLHETWSESGNSLHYNVLEAVKYVGTIDERLLKNLEHLGHDPLNVKKSLSILEDRNHSLIVPLRTNEGIRGGRTIVINTEYQITKKGDKYLEMAEIDKDWSCYRKVFGEPSGSLRRLL